MLTQCYKLRDILCLIWTNIIIIQITISSPSKSEAVTKEVSERFSKVTRAVAGGHPPSIARAVFSEPSLKECIIEKVINLLNDECAALCKKASNPPSLLRKFPIRKADLFSWDRCVEELVVKAPTLLKLLSFLVSRSDHRNKVI